MGLFAKKPPAEDVQLKRKEAQDNFVQLKRKVDFAVRMAKLEGQRARVALVIDISASMRDMFKKGTVQRVCERLLALGVKFDDNGAVDIFLFGEKDHSIGELTEQNFFGFVDEQIVSKYRFESDTKYAGVVNQIVKKYTSELGDPAYVLFVTDGDNSDKHDAEKAIVAASKYAIFWQFVGIGSGQFEFLEKMDTMSGRFIDNANFFALNDIDSVSDEDLYQRMLGEFPSWLKLSKEKGLW